MQSIRYTRGTDAGYLIHFFKNPSLFNGEQKEYAMNTFWKTYGRVAWLMAGIVLLSAVVTAFAGRVGLPRRDKTVVTATYPLYVAVENILGDTDALAVENLTGSAAGCLHDYQLSPANRIALENAALVLLNGGGAESFLDDTLTSLPDLPTVDTSAGLTLLESCHSHEHPHGDEPTDGEHDHAINEHLWVSPTCYAAQVAAATEALCALDPENTATYTANGEAYRQQVLAVGARLRAAAQKSAGKTCIIFHDSLAYLAEELGLTVAASLHVGEESGVSAADLAAAQRAVSDDPNVLLLYDSQYAVRYAAIDALVPADHVLSVDTAVIGRGRASDWLDAMTNNAIILENIKGGEQ